MNIMLYGNQGIFIENGICPICGGQVNLDNYTCENCGKYDCDVISIRSTADNKYMNMLKSAAMGDADAQLEIGYQYESRAEIPFRQELAHYWYKRASDGGNPIAQFNLATQYFCGRGVEKNIEKAAYWYKKSANQGWKNAQANVGAFYLEGECGFEKE